MTEKEARPNPAGENTPSMMAKMGTHCLPLGDLPQSPGGQAFGVLLCPDDTWEMS